MDVQSSATCLPQFQWMNNGMQQSPCLAASWLESACTNLSFTVEFLPDSESGYNAPSGSNANPCACSWAVYNLLSACGFCQGIDYQSTIRSWPYWIAECPPQLISASVPFPGNVTIPNETGIPFWATTNPTIWGANETFSPSTAQFLTAMGIPDYTSANQSSSTSTASSSSSASPPALQTGNTSQPVPAGAIAGAVIGSFLGILGLIILVYACLLKRKASDRVQSTDDDGYHLNLVGGRPKSRKKSGPQLLNILQPRPKRNGAYTITPFSDKPRRPRLESKDSGVSYHSQQSSIDETGALLNTSYAAAVNGTITRSTHPMASLDRNPRPLIRQGHTRTLSNESTYSLPMSITMSVTPSRVSTEREGSIDPYWLPARVSGEYEPSMRSEKSRRTIGSSPQMSSSSLPVDRDTDIAPVLRKERLNPSSNRNLSNSIAPVVRIPEEPASPPWNVSTTPTPGLGNVVTTTLPTANNNLKHRMNPPNYASVMSSSPPPAPSRDLSPGAPFRSNPSPSRPAVQLHTLHDFVEHPRVIHQAMAVAPAAGEPLMTDQGVIQSFR